MRPLLLAALILPALPSPAWAQSAGAKPAPKVSVFRQVIPNPTGRNGYEELVLAAETLSTSPVAEKVRNAATLTLTEKRAVVDDRTAVRVLTLIRQGLAKSISPPRAELNFETMLPELPLFRDLGRLLAIQQYVHLADGRTAEALGLARTGMKLARAVQTDTLIAGLVGIAIGTTCLRPLAQHLDQLSARDCVMLHQICMECLDQPSLFASVLRSDLKGTLSSIGKMRDEAKKGNVFAAAAALGINGEMLKGQAESIPQTPEEIDAAFTQIAARFETVFQGIMAEYAKPAWERRLTLPDQQKDFAGALVSQLMPSYEQVDRAYTREGAQVRLLACHAAIYRYKWEHDRLPGDLNVLNLGELARDPFTGLLLQYEVRGKRYSLTSAGAPSTDPDDPRAVNGRVPVTLTPDD